MSAPDAPGNPYLGNGFVGKGGEAMIPEYHMPGEQYLPPGAEMWRIGRDGSEKLVAVLNAKLKWVTVS